jgi:hypothetical protein
MRGLFYAHLWLFYVNKCVLRLPSETTESMSYIQLYDGRGPLPEKLTFLMCTVSKVAVQWLALLVYIRMVLGSLVCLETV